MFIAHASLPADDPETVARVLADILQGEALPFVPGGPRTWMAWSSDGNVDLEVAPRGVGLDRSADGANWLTSTGSRSRLSESHLAVGVDRPAEEVLAIARRAGWPAAIHDRGGFFQVVEVWVEGAFLIEFLDPQQAASYRRSMTPQNWKSAFGLA
jgi:hypothetical protein